MVIKRTKTEFEGKTNWKLALKIWARWEIKKEREKMRGLATNAKPTVDYTPFKDEGVVEMILMLSWKLVFGYRAITHAPLEGCGHYRHTDVPTHQLFFLKKYSCYWITK